MAGLFAVQEMATEKELECVVVTIVAMEIWTGNWTIIFALNMASSFTISTTIDVRWGGHTIIWVMMGTACHVNFHIIVAREPSIAPLGVTTIVTIFVFVQFLNIALSFVAFCGWTTVT